MILRELAMHYIAYNLVRMVMTDAALTYDVEANQLSFKGTLNAMQAYAAKLERTCCTQAHLKEVYDALLEAVAKDPLPKRSGRIEPRANIRRPKNYQLLNRPRKKMKEIQHRNTYRKAS